MSAIQFIQEVINECFQRMCHLLGLLLCLDENFKIGSVSVSSEEEDAFDTEEQDGCLFQLWKEVDDAYKSN